MEPKNLFPDLFLKQGSVKGNLPSKIFQKTAGQTTGSGVWCLKYSPPCSNDSEHVQSVLAFITYK